MNLETHRKEIAQNGFTVINNIFSTSEVELLLSIIANADTSNSSFRKSTDVFAIRRFLKEIPTLKKITFNNKLKEIIVQLFGQEYFIIKSIYFDKPEKSNWFVACHQDLTIAVDQKIETAHFGPWTIKQNQFGVQPPLAYLENNFTIRIHLDDTDENNGALKVIPKSHLNGVTRVDSINLFLQTASICTTKKGGIMIMRPLLLHSSNKTTNNMQRRVIHLEFSNQELTNGLSYAERINIFEKEN